MRPVLNFDLFYCPNASAVLSTIFLLNIPNTRPQFHSYKIIINFISIDDDGVIIYDDCGNGSGNRILF